MTPAQASSLSVKNDWYTLVKDATKDEAKKNEKQVQQIEVRMKLRKFLLVFQRAFSSLFVN